MTDQHVIGVDVNLHPLDVIYGVAARLQDHPISHCILIAVQEDGGAYVAATSGRKRLLGALIEAGLDVIEGAQEDESGSVGDREADEAVD